MKKLAILVLLLICCLGICGCNESDANICLDSKVNYVYTVPICDEQECIEIQIPFYRVYNGKDLYSDILNEKSEFIIGEDAHLEGDNVEELDGAVIMVSQSALNEYKDDQGYNQRLEECYVNKYSNSDDEKSDRKKISKIKDKYINNCQVVFFNIVSRENIKNDVSVSKLYIPELEIEYSFEQMEINTITLANDVKIDSGEIIDYSSLEGIFSDAFVSEYGYLTFEGVANCDIKDISVFSLNNNCDIVNQDNYEHYKDKESIYGELIHKNMKTQYKKDDEIELGYCYFFNQDIVNTDETDAVVSCLVVQTIDENDNKYWTLVYQPSIVSGRYFIMKLLYNEIA